ncbi:hypothetical protein CGZ80_08475 [Rhodopirellula sp. MGV]|nr:hypothetical protein CGZ80_08475 [Rhodopirellula sp. MGV]
MSLHRLEKSDTRSKPAWPHASLVVASGTRCRDDRTVEDVSVRDKINAGTDSAKLRETRGITSFTTFGTIRN